MDDDNIAGIIERHWSGGMLAQQTDRSDSRTAAENEAQNASAGIDVRCTDCKWTDARDPADVPTHCPACHARTERASEPQGDDGTWQSHME